MGLFPKKSHCVCRTILFFIVLFHFIEMASYECQAVLNLTIWLMVLLNFRRSSLHM